MTLDTLLSLSGPQCSHLPNGNNTLQDIVVRYHRMKGEPTLWVPGTDHAGIATQNVVERRLKAEGKSRRDLGREAFLERTWQVKNEHHAIITKQLKKIQCFHFIVPFILALIVMSLS